MNNCNLPPTLIDFPIPTPPYVTTAPEVVVVEFVAIVTVVVLPINALPAIPNPPEETNAPVVVEIDCVVCALLNHPFEVLKFPNVFPA